MLFQTSVDAQIESLISVASISASKMNESIASRNDLAEHYARFIADHYGRDFSKINSTFELAGRLVTDLEECSRLSSIFRDGVASRIDDLDQSSAIEFEIVLEEQAKKKEIIEKGLAFLKATSPDHCLIAELIVTDIVVLPSKVAYGGSTSAGLGIIWANPNMNWRAVDAAEFIVHELTHQCMFLDEICDAHYNYELLMQKENWAQSAILNKFRPVDKVLHSIAVATELLLFRERVGHPASSRAHPPTTRLLKQANSSILSLAEMDKRRPSILKERAREILANCSTCIASVERECELEI